MFKGVRALSSVRPSPYVCHNCRIRASRPRTPADQRRWLTQNFIRKIKEAEQEWAERAKATNSGERMSMLDLLEQRGYVNQIVGTRNQLNHLMINRRVGVYCGVDPTAPSLHVGHMVPFMVLGWLYIHGYSVYFLLGGATSSIGDPSGRLKEREKLQRVTHRANVASMHAQLRKLGELIERYAARHGYEREWAWKRALENNANWDRNLGLLDFLKSVGTVARLGPLLGRDTVKNRLEKGDGMSFAEFTYPLVQAYDWWHLYQRGVQIQVGGADQFGNILSGAEVVKQLNKEAKLTGSDHVMGQPIENPMKEPKGISNDPMGFTVPLLTTASGDKFGKSAGNAVWLDPEMTSSYDLYQFFLRSADADVEKYLKLLTFIPLSDIETLMEEHRKDESKRVAQHRLAKEFVGLVHGEKSAEKAEEEHRNTFKKSLSVADLRKVAADDSTRPADINPSLNKYAHPPRLEETLSNRLKLPASLVDRQPLSKILWSAGMVASRSEGQRLINARGVHIGGNSSGSGKMDDELSYTPIQNGSAEEVGRYIIDGELLILKIGKWKIKIINIVTDRDFEEAGLSCPGWKVEEEAKEDGAYAARQGKIEDSKKRIREAEKSRFKSTRFGVVREVR